MHTKKHIVISEDIKSFFPSTTSKVINNIWLRFFNCSPEVADLLTKLTTLNNELPQGWKTSSYLANLVFWDKEPQLYEQFENKGYSYSRFMDDISVSSNQMISDEEKSIIISSIYKMLFQKGYKPKRTKHKISLRHTPMEVTNLNVNSTKPTIPKPIRNNIRAQVHSCEKLFKVKRGTKEYKAAWNSASGKVGHLTRFHKDEGSKLRERLKAIKPPAIRNR